MTDTKVTVVRGLLGMVFPAGGITVSILPTVEAWLRVTSLVVGIVVGLVTLWKLTHRKD